MSDSKSATDSPGILLVANYSNRTGYAWNNIHRLYERIALDCREHGLVPWVSFARFEPPLELKHADVFEGVLELPPIPQGIPELRIWVQMIRRHRIRYLYLTDQGSWGFRYALYRLAGVLGIIVHCRVSVADPMPALPERGIRGMLKWLVYRIPYIQATRVYAVSQFVRNRLVVKAKVPSHRVVTILNGVDLERFAPSSAENKKRFVQIFCGARASVYKGIGVLIESAALLRDKFGLTDFKVLYAGDGPDLEDFVALAKKLDLNAQVVFLGRVPSTESLVRESDIVVVPSLWGDACPSAVSEALAAGKPLVATRVGGVPELVGYDGAAIMVDPGDLSQLAYNIANLIKNPAIRMNMGQKARQHALKFLDERRYHREVVRQLLSDFNIKDYSLGEMFE